LAGGILGWGPVPADDFVVVRDGATRAVSIERDHGYSAARATQLAEALGYTWTGAAMQMDGERVRFAPGSPFFSVGDEIFQLANPVYSDGANLMVPVSWALDWLPRERPRRWRYLDGRLVERPPTTLRPPTRDSWIVAIDAGHGGRDPGAIGVRGTKEKDVTLAIALDLAKRLRRERGIEVVLTREADTLIALTDRPRVLELSGLDHPPDLFLSIHGNSMPRVPNPARGVETYFLAVAKTDQARQVAMRENSALEFETDTPEEYLEPLQYILSDLQSTGNLQESSLLATVIQGSVSEALRAPNRGVKQAGLVVLVGATMPAVLVEVGYLSNRDEEMLLRSSSYQAKIADALADAVVDYLSDYGRRVWSSYDSGN
jgi:N-acetylmuramoyl-L-alanine amidase